MARTNQNFQVQLMFEHSVLRIWVCMPHRLQCKTQHFPKHKIPIHTTQNVQTQLYGAGNSKQSEIDSSAV